jgi:predicted nucleic acid-binding protein
LIPDLAADEQPVTLLLDTGIVYAYYDRSDAWHERSKAVIAGAHLGLVLPAPTIPEIDHLLRHRIGDAACAMFYRGLTDGSYVVADVPTEGYKRIVELTHQYPHLGFVDAAVIAIAEDRHLTQLATTDLRHFGPLAEPLGLQLVP